MLKLKICNRIKEAMISIAKHFFTKMESLVEYDLYERHSSGSV